MSDVRRAETVRDFLLEDLVGFLVRSADNRAEVR